MKTEDVTGDQLSLLAATIKVGMTPCADFGVWKPFGQGAARAQNSRRTSWTTVKEAPGPDSFATWEACWRVFRTAAVMCDIATAPLRSGRHQIRSELWESEFRRQSQFHDTNPEISAFVPADPGTT